MELLPRPGDGTQCLSRVLEPLMNSSFASSAAQRDFDVFLCHNSRDKRRVKQVAQALASRNILCWLDEEQIQPGTTWQQALERAISHVRAAAVFVSANGIGPWQQPEINALLQEFARRGCPVIPVIFHGRGSLPELPLFLRGMQWVDLKKSMPDPIDQLEWGITGQRPEPNVLVRGTLGRTA